MFNLQYITMNEICNILRIYKLSQLKAVTELEVIPKSGEKPLTVYPDHLDLELSPDQQDGGLLYKIEQTIPVSKLPEDEAVLFPIPTPSIIEGENTTGEKVIIGTPECPASVYIIPHLQKDQLSVTCSMQKSPF